MGNQLVKVLVRKGGDAETAWCARVKRDGRTLYRLANILFVHETPAWGDLVEAKESAKEDGRLTFTKVVEKSGRRTMIVDYEKKETYRALSKLVAKTFDVITEGCFAPKNGSPGRAYLALPKGVTPKQLFEAVRERFPDLVPIHPDLGVRPPKRKKVAPRPMDIHQAALLGKLPIVKRLLSEGVKVDALDEHGRTPLFMAILDGRYDVVRYLLGKGASVNAKNDRAPLVAAAMRGRPKEAKLLLERGANPNVGKGIDSVLAQAAYRGSLGVVRVLLDHDPDLEKCWALLEAASEGYLPIVKLLVARGADPGWRSPNKRVDALTVARKRKQRDVATYLAGLR